MKLSTNGSQLLSAYIDMAKGKRLYDWQYLSVLCRRQGNGG